MNKIEIYISDDDLKDIEKAKETFESKNHGEHISIERFVRLLTMIECRRLIENRKD